MTRSDAMFLGKVHNVNTAFLHAKLGKEIYISQPEGFVNMQQPNYISQLHAQAGTTQVEQGHQRPSTQVQQDAHQVRPVYLPSSQPSSGHPCTLHQDIQQAKHWPAKRWAPKRQPPGQQLRGSPRQVVAKRPEDEVHGHCVCPVGPGRIVVQ